MNWLTNMVRPKISTLWKKRDTAENLWHKCGNCGEMIFHRDLKAAQNVCPSCGHHMRLSAAERLASVFDDGAFEEIEVPDVQIDPLNFKDQEKYTDRLKKARQKTGDKDAVKVCFGELEHQRVIVALQNFAFMGGSLGMAAGEAIIKAAETAVEKKVPLILFAAAGGARMQEGILSLMQMPRTTIAIERLKEAGLPYIVVLTDPTTGGVTASYAMLGDIHIAEPGALIGFAGPRVIEQTIREKLPDGFQRAEYLLEHGMVDMVVHRKDMRATLARLVRLLMDKGVAAKKKPAAQEKAPKQATMPVPMTPPDVPSISERPANEDTDPAAEKDAAE
jgi:acetyl-CoA carboxylase carboxyl transferase subunit beta